MKFIKRIFLFNFTLFVFPFLIASECNGGNEIYIRTNQVGFLPDDIKTAVILSKEDLKGSEIQVITSLKNKIVFKSQLHKSEENFGNFNFTYNIDFSSLKEEGIYNLRIGKNDSYLFRISKDVYNGIAAELLSFFRMQRCGYTNPLGHEICHKSDATALRENNVDSEGTFDVTGGWHDAADYIKFFNTTAYSTYTLLFAYDFDSKKFGFDYDNNGVPDIIEEAKVGLDWLLRANIDNKKLVTQVQDLSDHDVGWRLPENDPLENDRPAYVGIGKNLIGMYTATLALASRIWKDKYDYNNFSELCLKTAENFYSIRDHVIDVDTSGTNHYRDSEYLGKMALGAVEMYLTTKNNDYYNDAVKYAEAAGSDYWWSWGNINSYAHYRLAAFDKKFIKYIENNLIAFSENSEKKLFNEGVALRWGSNNTLLGVALQNILYTKLTGKNTYKKLGLIHRDYMLGRNQWGVSFISKTGYDYSKEFHHQVSYLKKIKLPGGFAAGPVPKEYLDSQNIPFETNDRFMKFQTDDACYRDDRMDYITNEPTISANATAIFVMGFYANR